MGDLAARMPRGSDGELTSMGERPSPNIPRELYLPPWPGAGGAPRLGGQTRWGGHTSEDVPELEAAGVRGFS